MTVDRDFKRLVRRRMAKTGESYTTARAHLRSPERASTDSAGIDDLGRLYRRSGLDHLVAHLERRYETRIKWVTQLDLGVFRVDRENAPTWVARVFPEDRRLDQVEHDAEILRYLAEVGIPAERPAHAEPVSVLEGQGVLVTAHLPGMNARTDLSGETLFSLGELLGRIHTLPGADTVSAREAGGWHHISVNGGGRRANVDALLPLVTASNQRVLPEERGALEFICDALGDVDGCDGLPQTLIHPEPSGANAIVSTAGTPTLVDWAGAGRGPRVLSLGALLAGSVRPIPGVRPPFTPQRVDAVIAGYRTHARLTDDESGRLAAAIAGGAIVLDCWSFLFQGARVRELASCIEGMLATSERAAERAVEAFDLDEEVLTGWYAERPPAVHPEQGALF